MKNGGKSVAFIILFSVCIYIYIYSESPWGPELFGYQHSFKMSSEEDPDLSAPPCCKMNCSL